MPVLPEARSQPRPHCRFSGAWGREQKTNKSLRHPRLFPCHVGTQFPALWTRPRGFLLKLFLSTPGERIQVWKYQRIKQDIYHQFSSTWSSTIHMLVFTFQSPQRAAPCTWSRNFSCIHRTAVWSVSFPLAQIGAGSRALFLTVSGGICGLSTSQTLRHHQHYCTVYPHNERRVDLDRDCFVL